MGAAWLAGGQRRWVRCVLPLTSSPALLPLMMSSCDSSTVEPPLDAYTAPPCTRCTQTHSLRPQPATPETAPACGTRCARAATTPHGPAWPLPRAVSAGRRRQPHASVQAVSGTLSAAAGRAARPPAPAGLCRALAMPGAGGHHRGAAGARGPPAALSAVPGPAACHSHHAHMHALAAALAARPRSYSQAVPAACPRAVCAAQCCGAGSHSPCMRCILGSLLAPSAAGRHHSKQEHNLQRTCCRVSDTHTHRHTHALRH